MYSNWIQHQTLSCSLTIHSNVRLILLLSQSMPVNQANIQLYFQWISNYKMFSSMFNVVQCYSMLFNVQCCSMLFNVEYIQCSMLLFLLIHLWYACPIQWCFSPNFQFDSILYLFTSFTWPLSLVWLNITSLC